MTALSFTAKIRISGVNPYVLVSSARARRLKPGWRRPMPVLVQIDGQPDPPWRINMMPVGDGRFYLYLSGEVRKATRTRVGDNVTVGVAFDTKYRSGPVHPMPEWFRNALEANPEARKNWEALTLSRKKEILRYFSWLRSEEAKKRNMVRALQVLSGGRARFMGRSWNSGR